MNITKKARVATVAILAAILLSGCAQESTPPNADATTAPTVSATPTPTPTLSGDDAFEASLAGEVGVAVVEVIDPRTFVVKPNTYEAGQNGYTGEATVSIREESTLVTPAEGECGYDEALAYAKQYFSDNPEDAFVRDGDFGTDGYYEVVLRAGFAYIPDNDGQFAIAQAQADGSGAGLWSSCEGFGQ
jgi:endonuclease YncB( thermonuclease family)